MLDVTVDGEDDTTTSTSTTLMVMSMVLRWFLRHCRGYRPYDDHRRSRLDQEWRSMSVALQNTRSSNEAWSSHTILYLSKDEKHGYSFAWDTHALLLVRFFCSVIIQMVGVVGVVAGVVIFVVAKR
jgi:hypothetical protein